MLTKEPWFKKKRVGWGISPASWKAWTAMGVWALLVILFANALKKNVANGLIGMAIATVGLVVVVVATSERPGRRDK
jgi:hypothetical protein